MLKFICAIFGKIECLCKICNGRPFYRWSLNAHCSFVKIKVLCTHWFCSKKMEYASIIYNFLRKLAITHKFKMVDLDILQSLKWQNVLQSLSEVLYEIKEKNICADQFSWWYQESIAHMTILHWHGNTAKKLLKNNVDKSWHSTKKITH